MLLTPHQHLISRRTLLFLCMQGCGVLRRHAGTASCPHGRSFSAPSKALVFAEALRTAHRAAAPRRARRGRRRAAARVPWRRQRAGGVIDLEALLRRTAISARVTARAQIASL